jgi:transposase
VSKLKLKERASMDEVSIVGVDLAKNVFQVHGAATNGLATDEVR